MHISNVIVVSKKTFYEFLFLNKAFPERLKQMRLLKKDVALFKHMHISHQRTLKEVERVLQKYKVRYRVSNRKAHIRYPRYDFVITVGGDGTFLQAATHLTGQYVLGVNSDSNRSVGKFCVANEKTFEKIFRQILLGAPKIKKLPRFFLELKESGELIPILNDILVCDINPGAMSRYEIIVGKVSEEQRSSGLWVSTASGSTGGIRSSGGVVLKETSEKVQYRPRELYYREKDQYRLTGKVLSLDKSLKIRSLMRKGIICADGAHTKVPFTYGHIAIVRPSNIPIQTFVV